MLGLLTSSRSIGSVLGTMWAGHRPRFHRRGVLCFITIIVTGVAVSFIGLPVTIPGVALAALASGLSISIGNLVRTNMLQELVPREELGRVSSIDAMGSFALLPVGYGLAGILTDRLGAPLVFVLGGGLTALLAVPGIFHPAIRQPD